MKKNYPFNRSSNWYILISAIVLVGIAGCDPATNSISTDDTSEQKSTVGQDTISVSPEDIVQITTNPADQMNPNISIDRIVYDDNRNGNLDIFVYCLTNQTETQVTTDTTDQTDPDISEGRIVWAGAPALPDTLILTSDIFFLDLADNMKKQLTSTEEPIEEGTPEIYGNYVIWDRNFRGINAVYNLAGDTSYTLPRWQIGEGYGIWKNRAVFSGYTGMSRADLYLCDLTSPRSCETLFIEPGEAKYPDIHKDHIVWQDNQTEEFEGGEWDIFFYDLTTEEKIQITSDPGEQQHPAIFCKYIVWEDNRNGNWDIFLYNIATQETTQITSNSSDQRDPAIYGGYVIWEDNRNGNWDIYLYEIPNKDE